MGLDWDAFDEELDGLDELVGKSHCFGEIVEVFDYSFG